MEHAPAKVLITGAHGLIGNLVYNHLAAQPQRYDVYGMDRSTEASQNSFRSFLPVPNEKLWLANVVDFAAVQQAVDGMDVVVHLAADPSGASGWQSLLDNNIVGTQHVFEAARLGGVKRVIFASTNQVVFGYREDEPYRALHEGRYEEVNVATLQRIRETQPTRPLNLYACSKLFGESLAHTYAVSHRLSCICLRIGWVTPTNRVPERDGRTLWCSHRDIVQMIERCINAPPTLRFDVFFAASNNRYNLVDTQHARDVLGYEPQDSAETQLA